MQVFILIVYLAGGAEPALAYSDPADCWDAVERLRDEMSIVADCRIATIATNVGSPAPMNSPRPLPKPEWMK